jgi:hypothetical protein
MQSWAVPGMRAAAQMHLEVAGRQAGRQADKLSLQQVSKQQVAKPTTHGRGGCQQAIAAVFQTQCVCVCVCVCVVATLCKKGESAGEHRHTGVEVSLKPCVCCRCCCRPPDGQHEPASAVQAK